MDTGGVGCAGADSLALDGQIVLKNENKESLLRLLLLSASSFLLTDPAASVLVGWGRESFLTAVSSAETTEASDGRDNVGLDMDVDSISLEDGSLTISSDDDDHDGGRLWFVGRETTTTWKLEAAGKTKIDNDGRYLMTQFTYSAKWQMRWDWCMLQRKDDSSTFVVEESPDVIYGLSKPPVDPSSPKSVFRLSCWTTVDLLVGFNWIIKAVH